MPAQSQADPLPAAGKVRVAQASPSAREERERRSPRGCAFYLGGSGGVGACGCGSGGIGATPPPPPPMPLRISLRRVQDLSAVFSALLSRFSSVSVLPFSSTAGSTPRKML